MRAQSADGGFLDGDDDFVRGDQVADHVLVERLGKAQVGDGCAEALGIERVGRLDCFRQTGAEREDCNLLAFAHDAPLADFERNRRTSGSATPVPLPRG